MPPPSGWARRPAERRPVADVPDDPSAALSDDTVNERVAVLESLRVPADPIGGVEMFRYFLAVGPEW
jgi:hypothetical protein